MTTMTSHRTTDLTRTLLGAGLVAGPLFVGAVIVQLFTRVGFDLRRQPLSMLSLGEYGWIQVTNFIVAGVLSVLFAIGVARCLSDGPGSTWAPRLLALFGAGLVIGGIFTADPALGFPTRRTGRLSRTVVRSCHDSHLRTATGLPVRDSRLLDHRPPVRGRRHAAYGRARSGCRSGVLRAWHPRRTRVQRAPPSGSGPRLRFDCGIRPVLASAEGQL